MVDSNTGTSFFNRLKLAFAWNFRWSMLRQQFKESIVDLMEQSANFFWVVLHLGVLLLKLATLPAWVFILQPVGVAILVRPTNRVWKDIERVLERRHDA